MRWIELWAFHVLVIDLASNFAIVFEVLTFVILVHFSRKWLFEMERFVYLVVSMWWSRYFSYFNRKLFDSDLKWKIIFRLAICKFCHRLLSSLRIRMKRGWFVIDLVSNFFIVFVVLTFVIWYIFYVSDCLKWNVLFT